MKKETLKKSIDVPDDLFDQVMKWSYEEGIYKFSPAVNQLLAIALEHLDESNIDKLDLDKD